MTVQQRNSQMVDILRADFQGRYEPQFALAQVMSHMLALPGLRGFWPMSAYDASGNAFDQSGNARTLTYNGNPTYNFAGLAPYIDLDGTGDYLSRADEAGLDILGTETYVANPGLTFGGWFWFDDLTANRSCMGKWDDTGNNRGYLIQGRATNNVRLFISSAGTAASVVVVDHTGAISAGEWIHIVGRFTPSAEIAVFDNGVKEANVTSIPASIFNNAAALIVGAHNAGGAGILDGRASLCFLCASALSDAIIGNLFQQSRALFGV